MGSLPYFRLCGALIFSAATLAAACPAAAAGSYSPYSETASSALARYVRTLATDPKDFDTLIGAGRAALEIGDTQAAAGFFARADELKPRSPLPQVGMGSVSAANGDPAAAMSYFQRAQKLGAPLSSFACARGLANDLLGNQAQAQADYRVALNGPDAEEARRRLALSLAIAGDRSGALEALSPLMARRDPGAVRARAFVLALTGDPTGAIAAISAVMPGETSSLWPFVSRLPTLGAGQKAAAVNLGIFPESGSTAYASVAPPRQSRPAVVNDGNRLAGIDALLRQREPDSEPQKVQIQQARPPAPFQVSYSLPARPVQRQAVVAQAPRRIWLQLASGRNPGALPGQFERLKRANDELFDGIPGYVATGGDRARLLVGPFASARDAETFALDLASANITAFQWRNSETDRIVPVGDE